MYLLSKHDNFSTTKLPKEVPEPIVSRSQTLYLTAYAWEVNDR